MFTMTSLGDLYQITRQKDQEYLVEAFQKGHWCVLGSYSKARIKAALEERSLQKCSRVKAEKYIRTELAKMNNTTHNKQTNVKETKNNT